MAEKCTGGSVSCPNDLHKPSNTVCRPVDPISPCVAAERCTGNAAGCPSYQKKAIGATCDNGDMCTLNDNCTDSKGICKGTDTYQCMFRRSERNMT